jgi:hypothetical protein
MGWVYYGIDNGAWSWLAEWDCGTGSDGKAAIDKIAGDVFNGYSPGPGYICAIIPETSPDIGERVQKGAAVHRHLIQHSRSTTDEEGNTYHEVWFISDVFLMDEAMNVISRF